MVVMKSRKEVEMIDQSRQVRKGVGKLVRGMRIFTRTRMSRWIYWISERWRTFLPLVRSRRHRSRRNIVGTASEMLMGNLCSRMVTRTEKVMTMKT